MEKTKILLCGHCSLDPLGRHIISFIKCLLKDQRNDVYIEKDSLLKDFSTLEELFSEELKNNTLKLVQRNDNENYDFLVFTDSLELCPYQGWGIPFFSQRAKIKMCYPVFDGSVPPLHWIDNINANFDICLCASDYCAHNLKRYGVKIDCFCLECATLIEDYLNLFHTTNKVFRFGSIGASDFRKNIPLLIRSFAAAFTKSDPVELFIHSSYGKDEEYYNSMVRAYDKYKNECNITLQLKKISHEEMINLYSSFDAYISPQTTTGYFTTPLEACAAGIPVILSDIHPHLELKQFVEEENNLFFVNHKSISPAYHWVFDYRQLGCKFDGTESDYANVLKKVYENRNNLYSKLLISERKSGAEKLSADKLYKKYRLLFHPEKISISDVSYLSENDETFFMSKQLAKKYPSHLIIERQSSKSLEKDCATIYQEENSQIFKAIENCAVQSQKIWLRAYVHSYINEHRGILSSKYMQKLLSRSQRYGVTQLPCYIYKLFSLYCKTRHLFGQKIRTINHENNHHNNNHTYSPFGGGLHQGHH